MVCAFLTLSLSSRSELIYFTNEISQGIGEGAESVYYPEKKAARPELSPSPKQELLQKEGRGDIYSTDGEYMGYIQGNKIYNKKGLSMGFIWGDLIHWRGEEFYIRNGLEIYYETLYIAYIIWK